MQVAARFASAADVREFAPRDEVFRTVDELPGPNLELARYEDWNSASTPSEGVKEAVELLKRKGWFVNGDFIRRLEVCD